MSKMVKRLFILMIALLPMVILAQKEAQKAFSEGVRLLKANQFLKAEELFSIAIEKGEVEEGLKMAYIYKGFALRGLNKLNEAIINFDEAIKLDSTDAASFSDRGITYAYKEDYKRAIQDFNTVLVLDSTSNQAQAAYFYLGKIYSLRFQYEEAISYFDKLIELVPNDPEAYFLRGTCKGNIMDYEGSISDLDMAINYNPNYMEAYANRGVNKINQIPVKEKFGKKIKCLEDPCADLLKARALGDTSVEEMIFVYCKKCN